MRRPRNSITCPQCGFWAKLETFSNGLRSMATCRFCGFHMEGLYDAGSWTQWREHSGYGVIVILYAGNNSPWVHSFNDKDTFSVALRQFDTATFDPLWARATRWNQKTKTIEVVREFLAPGASIPKPFNMADTEAESRKPQGSETGKPRTPRRPLPLRDPEEKPEF